MNNYQYNSNVSKTQNTLIAQNIKTISNLELLKSEEAIRSVIESYMDRFEAIGNVITKASKYVVESKDIIDLKLFNDLFGSIFIDLNSLYKEIESVENVLYLNLYRNKNFYLNLKKKTRELWNKLYITKVSVANNSKDVSFIESFYTDIAAQESSNIFIDKKNGYVSINPITTKIVNNEFEIKTAKSITYPLPGDDTGVIHSVHPLNSINTSYSSGNKNLLKNGLWKEEIYTKDIPNMDINVGSIDVPIYRTYSGIVSIVDIEFVFPIKPNKLNFDIYGEFSTNIDGILFKNDIDEEWKIAKNFKGDDIEGEGFDIISFNNITNIEAKFLRIIFYQKNYTMISSSKDINDNLEEQIIKDLSENRYETIKFETYLNDLSVPNNQSNKDLYHKLLNILETNKSINNSLQKIEQILIPSLNIKYVDFDTTYKFEIGAWSIEPIINRYGIKSSNFKSLPYEINDKSLLSVSLNTIQETPNTSTCNWYINRSNIDIPILENSNNIRREPANFIKLDNLFNFKSWPGSFIALDFPMDINKTSNIKIFCNSILVTYNLVFLNSQLIYIHNLTKPNRSKYVIEYNVNNLDICKIYTLKLKTDYKNHIVPYEIFVDILNNIPKMLLFNNYELALLFISKIMCRWRIALGFTWFDLGVLSKFYTIEGSLTTYTECNAWLSNYTKSIFLDSRMNTNNENTTLYLDINNEYLDNYINIANSKFEMGNDIITRLDNYANNNIGEDIFNIISYTYNLIPNSILRRA